MAKKFTKKEVAVQVRQAVIDICGFPQDWVTEEKILVSDLTFDVLDLTELMMNIEDMFGVEFGDEIIDQQTVGGLINYVTENLEKKGMVAA